eukprot:1790195-Amphidinium_carterae.4
MATEPFLLSTGQNAFADPPMRIGAGIRATSSAKNRWILQGFRGRVLVGCTFARGTKELAENARHKRVYARVPPGEPLPTLPRQLRSLS